MYSRFLPLFVLCLTVAMPASVSPQGPQKQEKLGRMLLDLPAPPPGQPGPAEGETERDNDFYLWKNIPPDDAPIEDLLEYWKSDYGNGNSQSFKIPPTPKVLERLLDHCKSNPADITKILGNMPKNDQAVEGIKRIYETLTSDPEKVYIGGQVKLWLTHNSPIFLGDLAKQARRIRDKNDYVSNEDQIALKSLARLDWAAAESHVNRLEIDATQPYSQTLSYWIRYQHAIDVGDSTETERYRDKLKGLIENKEAPWAQRDLAMDALTAGGDWSGRDEWYISLLSDETLLAIQDNGYTGLTTMIQVSEPQKWTKRLIELTKSGNKTVRTAAARNLVSDGVDLETLEALSPWISDANWAKESKNEERSDLIEALGDHDFPNAVPLLITVLTNEEDFAQIAAKALASKEDKRAIPALKIALARDNDSETRGAVIDALVTLGGFSNDELLFSLESYLTLQATEKGRESFQTAKYSEYAYDGDDDEDAKPKTKKQKNPIPIEIFIGENVSEIAEPSEGLAVLAMERQKTLRKSNPELADDLAEVIRTWKGKAIYLEWIRQLRDGEANLETVLLLLANRKDVKEKLPLETEALRTSSGMLRGLGACISGNDLDFSTILATGDPASKVSALGCARLIRSIIPIDTAASLLNDKDADVRLAAEKFIESEDSPRARQLLISRRPGQATIYGARSAFFPETKASYKSEALMSIFSSVNGFPYLSHSEPLLNLHEKRLQEEIKTDPNLITIFAKIQNSAEGYQVIRVYKDRVRYTFYEDEARYREGELSEKEYKDFLSFLGTSKIDELPPSLRMCDHGGCPAAEFIMLGKNGGRRTYLSGYALTDPLKKLDAFYESFRTKDLRINYLLAKKIDGLEVIVSEEKFPIYTFWKNGTDARILTTDVATLDKKRTENAELEKQETETDEDADLTDEQRTERYVARRTRRVEIDSSFTGWRSLDGRKIGAASSQPDAISLDPKILPLAFSRDGSVNLAELRIPKNSGVTYVASRYSEGIMRGMLPDKFEIVKKGSYENVVALPDGKWLVASKFEGEYSDPPSLVRINLATGREYKIPLAPADRFLAVDFLASHKRVLVYRGPNERTVVPEIVPEEEGEAAEVTAVPKVSGVKRATTTPQLSEYYLLDAVTGAFTRVRGEFAPLMAGGFRRLQESSIPGETWAAIYDARTKTTSIGKYSEQKFTFLPILKLPDIELNSMDVWVDEKEGRVYFVYKTQLLSAPINQTR